MSGKIFVIEGMDFSGKSTLATSLVADLKAEGHDAIYFHCPRGVTPFTETLYDAIKNHSHEIDEMAKTFAIAATHVENIRAMLRLKSEGKLVVSDRSVLSMFAYQQTAAQFRTMLRTLHLDALFYLNVTDETIFDRKRKRGSKDELDEYFINNMRRIRTMYEMYLEEDIQLSSKTYRVDANRPAEDVHAAVYGVIKTILTGIVS